MKSSKRFSRTLEKKTRRNTAKETICRTLEEPYSVIPNKRSHSVNRLLTAYAHFSRIPTLTSYETQALYYLAGSNPHARALSLNYYIIRTRRILSPAHPRILAPSRKSNPRGAAHLQQN